MHRGKNKARVLHLAPDVLGPVVPIDAQRVDRIRIVVLDVQELHDASEIVRLARWLTDQINVICRTASANPWPSLSLQKKKVKGQTYRSPRALCRRRPPFCRL